MTRNFDVRIGLADIAELANVAQSSVSHWRRRYPDFPKPYGDDSLRATFSLEEVREWLFKRGRITELSGSSLAERELYLSFNLARQWWSPQRTVKYLINLLVLNKFLTSQENFFEDTKKANASAWVRLREIEDEFFLRELATLISEILERDPDSPIQSIESLFNEIGPEDNKIAIQVFSLLDACIDYNFAHAYLFDLILNWRSKVSRLEATTSDSLRTLIHALAPRSVKKIADLAVGTGKLLDLAESEKHPSDIERIFIGFEVDSEELWICRVRFFLQGKKFTGFLQDSINSEEIGNVNADLVVIDPPMGLRIDSSALSHLQVGKWRFGAPPVRSADLAWPQLALKALGVGGVGLVVTPQSALFVNDLLSKQIRRRMLDAGVIKALILLPGRVLERSSIPTCIWVVGDGSKNPKSEVLLMDLMSAGTLKQSSVEFSSQIMTACSKTIERWLEKGICEPNNLFPTKAIQFSENWDVSFQAAFRELLEIRPPSRAELVHEYRVKTAILGKLLDENRHTVTELESFLRERIEDGKN